MRKFFHWFLFIIVVRLSSLTLLKSKIRECARQGEANRIVKILFLPLMPWERWNVFSPVINFRVTAYGVEHECAWICSLHAYIIKKRLLTFRARAYKEASTRLIDSFEVCRIEYRITISNGELCTNCRIENTKLISSFKPIARLFIFNLKDDENLKRKCGREALSDVWINFVARSNCCCVK